MSELVLQVQHLSKSFGSHEILRDIDFSVHAGDVTSIIGASGSGKSTLLRCINLLETPSDGHILFHGQDMAGRHTNAAAYRAKVGMVFQSFNLFNNMTVLENCMEGARKVLHVSKEEAFDRAIKHLKEVGMAPYINARPDQLSGGQKQKFLLARALYKDAPVLILDEPTAALDPIAESEIYDEYAKLSKDKTAIFISHRLASTRFSDRILLIGNQGILEEGTHEELLANCEVYRQIAKSQMSEKELGLAGDTEREEQ